MNHDGTKAGFANEALAHLSELVNIPIIASGGAGTVQHFIDTFTIGKVDAALAASVFHFSEISILELKLTNFIYYKISKVVSILLMPTKSRWNVVKTDSLDSSGQLNL
jgi:imidazole glycerol phosphate synthase subunit HisF